MENKKIFDPKEEEKTKADLYFSYAKLLLIILAVVAVGLIAVNQTLEYFYRAEFLKSPCSLCMELNKNQSVCIGNCFKYERNLYPDVLGNWKDQTGKCYDLSWKEISCRGDYLFEPINFSQLT